VSYGSQTPEGARVSAILGIPNPVTWVFGFASALWLAVSPLARRRKQVESANRGSPSELAFKPSIPILAMVALTYLPYLAASLLGRQMFFYYAMPVGLFLVLAIVECFSRMDVKRRITKKALAAFIAASVGMFVYFYPVYVGASLPRDGVMGWRGRIWLTYDCDRPVFSKIACWR